MAFDTVGYYEEGFLTLQRAIHKSSIEYLLETSNLTNTTLPDLDDFKLLMERFPYPPYKYDVFLSVIQMQLPFLIMLSLIFIALNIPKEVVLEKERKLKVS